MTLWWHSSGGLERSKHFCTFQLNIDRSRTPVGNLRKGEYTQGALFSPKSSTLDYAQMKSLSCMFYIPDDKTWFGIDKSNITLSIFILVWILEPCNKRNTNQNFIYLFTCCYFFINLITLNYYDNEWKSLQKGYWICYLRILHIYW